MTELDDFTRTYGHLLGYVEEATKEMYRRFDALFERGLPPGPDDDWREYGRWAQLKLSLGPEGGHDHDERVLQLIRSVAERDIPWTPGDARVLVYIAQSLVYRGHTRYEEIFRLPLAVTRRFGFQERRVILESIGAERWLLEHRLPVWEALAEQFDGLLIEPAENGPAGVVRNVIWECDDVARVLAEEYGARLAAPEVLPLLRHWNTARSSKPSGKWLKTAATLLTPEAAGLVREILVLVAAHREKTIDHVADNGYEWRETVFLHERTAVPVRGMVWTCELIDEPWVVSLLGDVALTCGTGIGGSGANCRSERLANAAVNVLARRGGLETVASLARVQVKVRKKTVLANVARTLDAVAAQAGLSREQLLDRTVPTFGLGPDGVREEKIGDCLVQLRADGPALRFVNPAGRSVKSAPQAIRKDPALAELKTTLKELKQTLPAERFRLEQALIEERLWRWQQVTEFFLDHPVTGLYARNLIWQILQGPAGLPVRTDTGWELTDPRGRRIQPNPDTPVQLWHPIREAAEDVRAWRDHLLEHGVRQPYKQAFREVYLLTPAEEQTRTYSNRFAGHVLRYGQAKALLNQRGWTDLSIGHWDYESGGQSEAVKDLSGWRARWGMHITGDPEADGWGTASFCASEQIRFHRDGQEAADRYDYAYREGVPLDEVPPLVLSEVLRDADLAVGVTSVGLDQQAAGGHEEYWHSYGFGELTETARTRRDALTRLLPRLRIADRAELTDRFLRVRGDLRTYRIHLGSGNILMEPNDAYLCVVPGNDRGAASVFLPFEEDGGMLSVILSKAFLLADDTAITDPSITRQLGA
ncbi:DUF4132 domain-containing protein [Streptosporangium roseum]|uniref:Uncharacterized protein n=1 Tax=Streptosporangium roseum (strain ATCC 12428 / DSM 43021 / JCM 3005 / KCTC 9067 / NCIMB 10171 / NRRL 2505 / NI 9100) TaxID=479432 RepID=D2AT00_STRRD|nr:DUF4132 domain-containing protein [Streptosporangium roseum]ACZ90477.1 hypothetical protein Sros_7811 [Streptosporangium roseum DSM 43021]